MNKLIEYINNNCDIDEEYYQIFGKHLPHGKCFCPFHPNHNTPAAKRYGNGIKCFGSCNRYFGVYDLLKRFNPDRINEIKSSIILPEASSKSIRTFAIKPIDRTKSISEIIKYILQ